MTTTAPRLSLGSETAAELMQGPVASLSHRATFHEAIAFFIDRNVTVAPVVGEFAEPVGVLSIADLLIHVRESLPTDRVTPATASDLMTPAVFSVNPETPAADVVRDMLRSNVHHLFVTEPDGRIIGVVSTCDVLRCLQGSGAGANSTDI
jgi:predicted transcriptional regulator